MFSKLILLGKNNSPSKDNAARTTKNSVKTAASVGDLSIVKVTIKGVYTGWFGIIILVLIFLMKSA